MALRLERRHINDEAICLSKCSHASLIFCIGMISMSEAILCFAQKSSISWVSGMPPMAEPAKLRRGKITDQVLLVWR